MSTQPGPVANRKDKAGKIIHSAASAASASTALASLGPLAGVGTMMVTATNVGMTVALAKLFNVELDKTSAREILTSVAGSAIGITAARTLLGFVPLLGNVANGAVTFAYTEAVGWKIYSHFEAEKSSSTEKEAGPGRSPTTIPRHRAFICYCHDDAKYVNEFRKFLKCYEIEMLIDVFSDKDITAGADWRSVIANALQRTRVAVCFLSPGLLLSEFIRGMELPALLEGAEKEGVICLPIVVSPTPRTETVDRLLRYQSPVALEPIKGMRPVDRDEVYKIMAEAVVGALKPNVLVGSPASAT